MSHKDKYNFKIINEYQLTTEDSTIISSGKQANKKWKDSHFKPFKDRIRNHLKIEQKKRCAFCRLRINDAQFYPHLEHLVPKKKSQIIDPDRKFEFTPNNLVLSCQRCNFDKGQIQTLVDVSITDFPTTSDAFCIVNPYLDDYLEHIDFLLDIFIFPKINSTKGKNTIDFYKLDKLELTEARAFEANISKIEASSFFKSQILIMQHQGVKDLLSRILNLIDHIPKWIED